MEEVLEAVYTDPRLPGSFSGPEKLKRGVQKSQDYTVSIKSIKEWLRQKDTYTKYRAARKNFPRNRIVAANIVALWQGDLAEVGDLIKENGDVKYLLVIIDVMSKYVWVEPLKTKECKEILTAMKNIFQRSGRKPEKLQTDQGGEFLGKPLQNFLKKEKIQFYTVKSDKKAAVVERVIRTLKDKLYRYMHEKHTRRYIDVLQDLVASYNDTYHRSIKRAPSDVSMENEGKVLETLYGDAWKVDRLDLQGKQRVNRPKLKVGDFVRITKLKGVFAKGYWGNWTEELFIVRSVEERRPYIVYKLEDWKREPIEGAFYEHELQLVSKDLEGFWKVEKVVKTRKVRGKKEHWVKWEGYPESMNSWVSDEDIKKLGPLNDQDQ